MPWKSNKGCGEQNDHHLELQVLGDWGRQDMGLGAREGSSELSLDNWSISMTLAVYDT